MKSSYVENWVHLLDTDFEDYVVSNENTKTI